MSELIVVPIEIRRDCTVKIMMPTDLKTEEARKVARVIKAMAVDPRARSASITVKEIEG